MQPPVEQLRNGLTSLDDENEFPDIGEGLAEAGEPVLTPRNVKDRIEQERQTASELNDLFIGLNYSTDKYKATLRRLKPSTDDNGVDILGWTWDGSEPLSEAEVSAQFGGGSYQWLVHGPDPRKGGDVGILKNIRFKVSGPPKPKGKSAADGATNATLVQSALDSKEKDTQRLVDTYKDEMKRRDSEIAELRALVLKGQGGGLMEFLAHQEHQRKIDLEERKLEFEKLKAERDAEARERAAADERRRIADEKKEEARLAREAQERTERRAAEDKLAAERKALEERLAKESAKAGDQVVNIMTQQFNQTLQMMDAGAKSREAVLTQMMAMAQTHSQQVMGLIAQKTESPFNGILEKVAQEAILEKFTGGKEPPANSLVDQASAFLKENGGLPAILRETRGLFTPAAPVAARPAQPAPPARVIPGSVAVVDLPPVRQIPRRSSPPPAAPKPAPAPAPGLVVAPSSEESVARSNAQTAQNRDPHNQAGPASSPAPFAEESPTMAALANATPPQAPVVPLIPAVQVESANGFTVALPNPGDNQEDTFRLLAMNLEGALKADWKAKQVWDLILMKFPESIRHLLKSMTPEQIAVEIEREAPADWTLNSPRGHKLLIQLDGFLQNAF